MMGNAMRKSLLVAFLIECILFGGFALAVTLRFGTVQASTGDSGILKPSVPEFTLRYIDLSYDVPPTYGIDQFTGKNVTKQEGYHVDNQSIAFRIKNQPFTSYNDSSGNNISLYYNFKFKGHFGNEWSYYPFSESGQGTRRYSAMFYVLIDQSPKLPASNSEYTDIVLGLPFLFGVQNPPVGSQVDFQVQALIGHIDYAGDGFYSYTGQRSDWSNTQTITIGTNASPSTSDTSPSTSPSPTSPDSSSSSPQNSASATTPDQSDNQAVSETDFYGIAVTASIALTVIVALTAGIMFVRGRSRRRGDST
jgi:hypothetical protein